MSKTHSFDMTTTIKYVTKSIFVSVVLKICSSVLELSFSCLLSDFFSLSSLFSLFFFNFSSSFSKWQTVIEWIAKQFLTRLTSEFTILPPFETQKKHVLKEKHLKASDYIGIFK